MSVYKCKSCGDWCDLGSIGVKRKCRCKLQSELESVTSKIAGYMDCEPDDNADLCEAVRLLAAERDRLAEAVLKYGENDVDTDNGWCGVCCNAARYKHKPDCPVELAWKVRGDET